MEQLGQNFGAVFMYLRTELFPAGDERIIVNGHITGQVNIGRFYGHHFGHDQTHTAPGPGTVMLHQFVGHIAFVCQIGGDGRHKHAVFHGLGSNLNGFK